MTVTLVLPEEIDESLAVVARNELETAGVLLASVVHAPNGDTRLLGRHIRWVDIRHYKIRKPERMSIGSEGYIHALGEAEVLGAMAIWVHTHPGIRGVPMPSEHDVRVDEQISDLFRLRSGNNYYGALIVSPRTSSTAFSGHVESDDGEAMPIDRIWVVGDRFRLKRAFDSELPKLSTIFDRNVSAFGSAIQRTVGDLHVGIVGCGGTGSSTAEQLVRLGVRQVSLFDADELSASNVTRVYGSTLSQVGVPKVDVLADHLDRIAPDVRCHRIKGMITSQDIAKQLTSCDVVFGCTDDNAGRLVLSRLASFFLTPVIDCGVLLSSDNEGRLTGIDCRVTVLTPGQACLLCRRRINVSRASAELLTPEERQHREDEGYAPALGATEPAVITFTTLVSATAVSELLERFVGYGPVPRPSEILIRCHEREISTNVSAPRQGHYCHPDAGKLGIGITEPFLEMLWSN